MRKSKSIFSNKVRDFSVNDPDKVYDAYRKSQIEKLKHNQRLRTTVRAYKALGMDEGDMYRALIKEGALSPQVARDEFEPMNAHDWHLSQIIFADKNIFRPDMIDTSLIRYSEIGSKTPIPIDKIIELNRKLQNLKID